MSEPVIVDNAQLGMAVGESVQRSEQEATVTAQTAVEISTEASREAFDARTEIESVRSEMSSLAASVRQLLERETVAEATEPPPEKVESSSETEPVKEEPSKESKKGTRYGSRRYFG